MKQLTKKERLNKLFKEYGLTTEDYFTHAGQKWTIITRSGIDAIQAGANIKVSYEVVKMDRDFVVIKGSGQMGEKQIESFGEALVGNYPKGNTKSNYPVSIAEKRCMARVVLKLAGFYQLGAFSEDESDDFKQDNKLKDLPIAAINKGNNAILKGEKKAEELIELLEADGYLIPDTVKYAWKSMQPTVYSTNE